MGRIAPESGDADRWPFASDLEQSRRSPESATESILGARKRLSRGSSGTHESRRKRGAIGADGPRIRRPGSMVSPVVRISRGISRNPGDRLIRLPRTFSVQGEIMRRPVGNGQKSSNARRDRGEWAQNQAARIDCQSVRIFWKSREIPAIAGFGVRKHSRRKRD